jgi:DNA-binding MurR/RpiR family transcriptional regulator
MSKPAPDTGSVADRTRDLLGSLSPGERKVARALLAAYPVAGLETVADLADRAKVSAPTVLRFAARLGYSSYPLLQQALMREIHEQMGSPLRRMSDTSTPPPLPGSLTEVAAAYVASVNESFARIPQSELDLAVDLLSDSRLGITLIGGRFSQVLATYFANHLVLMRPAVAVLPTDRLQRDATLLDLGKRDLLVVFDYRRYDADVVEVARRANKNGARVLLFTDPWLSPAAEIATAVIPAQVEAVGPFDSLAPAMSVVETVVAAVNIRLARTSKERITRLERDDAGS